MNQRSNLEPAVEAAVRKFISLISARYDIERVIVYGSRARGDHREDSDIDVAVLLRGEPQSRFRVMNDMTDSAFDVLNTTDLLVSPVPFWSDEWANPENSSSQILMRNIQREGIQV